VPLKVGIFEEIVERLGLGAEDQAALRFVLHHHVNGYLYQKAVVADDAVRLDLDRQPAGAVTPEQRDFAVERAARLCEPAMATKEGAGACPRRRGRQEMG